MINRCSANAPYKVIWQIIEISMLKKQQEERVEKNKIKKSLLREEREREIACFNWNVLLVLPRGR